MHSKIVRRIDGESGVFSKLASELSPSDLQSLLLGVYQTRAAKLDETDIMARARQTRDFFRVSIAMHSHARKGSTQWLAPVCPFATTSVLGGIDQNNVLTAIRNAGVLGHSTPALALECIQRRKNPEDRKAVIRLRYRIGSIRNRLLARTHSLLSAIVSRFERRRLCDREPSGRNLGCCPDAGTVKGPGRGGRPA